MSTGRWIVGCLAAGIAGAAVVGGTLKVRAVRAENDRQAGLKLAQQGRLQAAAPLLRAALARDPHDVPALKALRLGAVVAKNTRDEEDYLLRWCAAAPNDAEPLVLLMVLHQQLGRLETAIEDGRRALELTPEDDRLRSNVAEQLIVFGRYPEAIADCRRCLEHQPNNPEFHYLLANAYHRQGQNAKASAILDPLVREHREFTGATLLRAIIHYEDNQPAQAIPLLKDVLAQGQNSKAQFYLGQCLARTGHEAEGKRLVEQSQLQAPAP